MDFMPPDNQLPPHHAPTGLKIWLAIFGVVLVVALGYLVWVSNTAPDTTDDTATVTVKKTATNETASWKTYTGTDYTYEYPATATLPDKSALFVSYGLNYVVETPVVGSHTTIESWLTDSNISATSTDLTKYTKTEVAGEVAYTFTGELRTYLMHSGVVYALIARDGVAPSAKINDAAYAHFLSSFKFTK